MYGVIERKVAAFEKRIESECRRTDEDKLLESSMLDYTDCLMLSKERLLVLLTRDERRHQECLDELIYKKNAWEDEL